MEKFKCIFFILIIHLIKNADCWWHEDGENWQLGIFVKHDAMNPILLPRNDTTFHCPVRNESVTWEAKDVFNPTALVLNGKVHLLYRAEDEIGVALGTSRIGLATSDDGVNFVRELEPIFYPDNDDMLIYEWEGGCEDPRIVQSPNGEFIMTYTAYDGTTARLLVASSPDLRNWTKYGPVFRNAYNGSLIDLWSKSGSIVCELVGERFTAKMINGKYWMYWGDTHMFVAHSDDLVDWTPVSLEDNGEKMFAVFSPRPGYFDSDLVEPGPQAFITPDGILLIYNSRNKDKENGGDPAIPDWTYTVGQALLNVSNPLQIIKRSEKYFMRPDKDYELVGQVNKVVFLEGLVHFKGNFYVYYGTADSKIAVASVTLLNGDWELGPFEKRDEVNPFMGPNNSTSFLCPVRNETVKWQEKDVFNPTAVVIDGHVVLLYRAEDYIGAANGTSRIGVAISEDGLNFDTESRPVFYPNNDEYLEFEWEGGCEDPRIAQSEEDGKYYMTYTGYDGELARLMIASSPDLFTWTKHGSVFKTAFEGYFVNIWSKAGSIVCERKGENFFPTKINGKFWMYWGETSVFAATSDDLINWTPVLEPWAEGINETGLYEVFRPRAGKFDSDIVEPGPQAFLIDDGILLIYNGRNKINGGDPELPDRNYAAGQVLMSKLDPTKVIMRTDSYFFRPEKDYEVDGQVNHVVFLEGLVYFEQKWFLYYGTADSKIAVATIGYEYQKPGSTTPEPESTTPEPGLTTPEPESTTPEPDGAILISSSFYIFCPFFYFILNY